jgi:cation:H+ antiporter
MDRPFRRGLTSAVVAVLLLAAVCVGPVVAQNAGGGGVEASEGEPPITGVPAILVFLAGAALLILSAEKFIGYLVNAASGLNFSLFILAVIFTGIEFDDTVLGVATNLEDLGGVALGTVLGTALSLTGVTLALAAVLTPFDVDVPRDYLVVFALSPLAILPVALSGVVTATHGVVLIAVYLLILGYVVWREADNDTPVFRDAEVERVVDGGQLRTFSTELPFVPDRRLSGWAWLGLSAAALVLIVVGAESMAIATEGIVATYGLGETVFGATVVTAVLTLEDVFLTVESVRRGAAEIGIGNVIGSVLFSVTANLGVVALVGSIAIDSTVLTWHLPVLVGSTALAAYFIGTERLRPRHGYALLGIYAAYWAVSLLVFGGIPVEL